MIERSWLRAQDEFDSDELVDCLDEDREVIWICGLEFTNYQVQQLEVQDELADLKGSASLTYISDGPHDLHLDFII